MTRLVVVADIHGNMAALEAVVADMAHKRPRQFDALYGAVLKDD